MRRLTGLLIGCMCTALAIPQLASAQGPPDTAALIEAQREAMAAFDMMDGEWRGTGWTILPSGEKAELTQTERVGPFLDGAIKVVEGRGYDEAGETGFNAMGIISYDPATESYTMHSYAQGHSGDFVIRPTDTGFEWEIPAGPMTIRYSAEVDGKTWTEVGDREMPGQDPVRFFEMTLSRIGDSTWPAGGAVSPK